MGVTYLKLLLSLFFVAVGVAIASSGLFHWSVGIAIGLLAAMALELLLT